MNAQLKPSDPGYDETVTGLIMAELNPLPNGEGMRFDTMSAIPAIRAMVQNRQHLLGVLTNMTRRGLIFKHTRYGYAAVRGVIKEPMTTSAALPVRASKSKSRKKPPAEKAVAAVTEQHEEENPVPETNNKQSDDKGYQVIDPELIEAVQRMGKMIKAGGHPCPRLSRIEEKIYAANHVAKMADEPLRTIMAELADDLQLIAKAS